MNADQREHGLEIHVALGAYEFGLLAWCATKIGEGLTQPRGQALAHIEQGVCRAHEHASHGDGTNDKLPHRKSHAGPVAGRSRREDTL